MNLLASGMMIASTLLAQRSLALAQEHKTEKDAKKQVCMRAASLDKGCESLRLSIKDEQRASRFGGDYIEYWHLMAQLLNAQNRSIGEVKFCNRKETISIPRDFDGKLQITGIISGLYGFIWRQSVCKKVNYQLRITSDHTGKIWLGKPEPPDGRSAVTTCYSPSAVMSPFDLLDDVDLEIKLINAEQSRLIVAPSIVRSSQGHSFGLSLFLSYSVPVRVSDIDNITAPHLELKLISEGEKEVNSCLSFEPNRLYDLF